MREDGGAAPAPRLVPAGVVEVVVRVDDEAHLARLALGELGDLRGDAVCELGELVVDHDRAIRADEQRDVAARAGEHVQPAAEIDVLHDGVLEVDLRVGGEAEHRGGRRPCGQA